MLINNIEKTILNLFKKRLLTVVKVNLLPALAVGFGNLSILLVSHNTNILMMISQFIFIIILNLHLFNRCTDEYNRFVFL